MTTETILAWALGILGSIAVAGAGYVYQIARRSMDLLIGLRAQLAAVESHVKAIAMDLREHDDKPYHASSGALHASAAADRAALRRDVDRLDRAQGNGRMG